MARSLDEASPARSAFAINKSDTVSFSTAARGIYVGGAGDVTVLTSEGETVTFTAVPAGMILPIVCTRVNETGTDATNMVGLR